MQLRRRTPAGQILVVFVLALVAMIAMGGLILDGGALFAQQRVAQNGADGAATAGTLVIAENLAEPGVNDGADVYREIDEAADANGLANWSAIYTDVFGDPIGETVVDSGDIPDLARGVQVSGTRDTATTFSRVVGINNLSATAVATVIAGAQSTTCVADEDGCTLLPVTFPIHVSQCDAHGNLIPGPWIGAPPPDADPTDPYWPIVGADALPSASNPSGDTTKMAILPLCKSSSGGSGAFGWLDLDASKNLAQEIVGPLTDPVSIPDWFQTQPGNPNSVDDEISAYIHQPVLIPLNNGACRIDPGDTDTCPLAEEGVDPVGNNTWYYVHTLAVFYIDQVLVQGSNVNACASPPGSPQVPVTNGSGFLGCLKGWFVKYVTSGPVDPEGDPSTGALAIQLIR